MNKIQQTLNAISYPQNYYYDIETLEPIGLLKKRLEAFKIGAPELFKSYNSFLDIGSSIGYFLFYHSLKSKKVVGIEPESGAVDLCLQIKKIRRSINLEIINSKFSQYESEDKFDLIFIGNAFHYLYKDEGWIVLQKLAKISNNFIVMEFPMEGKHLIEIGGWKEDETTRDFTEKRFKEEVKKNSFEIIRTSRSGTMGDRKIVVIKK